MSKKDRKQAMKFILSNRIILGKIADALGCDKHLSKKEKATVVENMISTYREENYVDPFSINVLGTSKNRGFRDDRMDEYLNMNHIKINKGKKGMESIIDGLIKK